MKQILMELLGKLIWNILQLCYDRGKRALKANKKNCVVYGIVRWILYWKLFLRKWFIYFRCGNCSVKSAPHCTKIITEKVNGLCWSHIRNANLQEPRRETSNNGRILHYVEVYYWVDPSSLNLQAEGRFAPRDHWKKSRF